MFDVDDTLLLSDDFDGDCFLAAVETVLGQRPDDDWTRYTHVSDAGILDQLIDEAGRASERVALQAAVKENFTERIATHLARHPVEALPGAAGFLLHLRRLDAVSLSIATGGWRETALLKLESAGLEITGLPLASSSDHHARIEIMRHARRLATGADEAPVTYFGDGEWDRRACAELGFDFVLVGSRTQHSTRIDDFTDIAGILSLIGLPPAIID